LRVTIRRVQCVLSVHSAATESKRGETYAEAAARIRIQRELEGRKAVSDERIHDALYLCPVFGELPVTEIRPSHIRDALEAARETGKSQKTLANIRGSASIVFEDLWRSEVIEENPVSRAPFVRAHVDRRERAVLTDEELVVYLAWRHPDERFDVFVAQRQTMSLVSRLLGGARVGDLHSITWQSFDLEEFSFGWVPRNKTERPQRMHIDPALRPYLAAWHQRMGSPREGLVFPRLIGAGAGELGKPGSSYAEELRRDLKRAMGLEAYTDGRWVEAVAEADYTPRQRELFTETEYTRPVDFHSWRRAFNQALADAGMNAQQAAALAGHSSLEAHQKYLRNTAKAATLPQSAVPKLADFRQTPRPKMNADPLKSQEENGWRRRESNPGPEAIAVGLYVRSP
jgi:integrase